MIVPTLSSYYGDSKQKASADMIQQKIREARAKAMETGVWYRLAISSDKKKIRLAPDCQNFDSLEAGDANGFNSQVVEESLEEGVTAEVVSSDDNQLANAVLYQTPGASATNNAGPSSSWTTIMTFGPEGICREGLVTVAVKEGKFQDVTIQVRGIVGSSSIVPTPKGGYNK